MNNRERIIKAIAVSKSQLEFSSGHFEPDSSGEKSVNTIGKDFLVTSLPRIDNNKIANPLVVGVSLNRDEIKKRITSRLKKRLDEEGMIEEVKSLMNAGISFDKMVFFGLEYKFIAQYLIGELNKNDMFQKLNSAIHSFAKRQMTWFRKMEKQGVVINWIDGPDFNKAKELIEIELQFNSFQRSIFKIFKNIEISNFSLDQKNLTIFISHCESRFHRDEAICYNLSPKYEYKC